MNARLVVLAVLMLTTAAGRPVKAPAVAPAAPVTAPAATTAGCLLVSNAFATGATEEKYRSLAQAALYFFMGRIDDRTTPEQLKSALNEQGRVINKDNASELMNSCLRLVQEKSLLLKSAAQQPKQSR